MKRLLLLTTISALSVIGSAAASNCQNVDLRGEWFFEATYHVGAGAGSIICRNVRLNRMGRVTDSQAEVGSCYVRYLPNGSKSGAFVHGRVHVAASCSVRTEFSLISAKLNPIFGNHPCRLEMNGVMEPRVSLKKRQIGGDEVLLAGTCGESIIARGSLVRRPDTPNILQDDYNGGRRLGLGPSDRDRPGRY